jgi:hypothetical protein
LSYVQLSIHYPLSIDATREKSKKETFALRRPAHSNSITMTPKKGVVTVRIRYSVVESHRLPHCVRMEDATSIRKRLCNSPRGHTCATFVDFFIAESFPFVLGVAIFGGYVLIFICLVCLHSRRDWIRSLFFCEYGNFGVGTKSCGSLVG